MFRSSQARRCGDLRLEALESRTLLSLAGSEFLVNSLANGQHQAANASSFSDDHTVVVWNDNRDIKARVFDRIGNKVGSEITVANSALGEYDPAVAMDGQGNFVVTWTEEQTGGGSEFVRAARFQVDGTKLGSTLAVATRSGHHQNQSRVGRDVQGNFVITYTNDEVFPDHTNLEVRARLYFASGSFNREIVVEHLSFTQIQHSSVSCASDGRFAVAMEFGNSVQLDRFTAAGDREAVNGRLSLPHTLRGREAAPSLAMGPFGDCTAAYQALVPLTGLWDVKVQHFLSDGTAQPEVLIANGLATDPLPAVAVPTNDTMFVVAYRQNRSGNNFLLVTEETATSITTHTLGFVQNWETPSISVTRDFRYLATCTSTTGDGIHGQFGWLGGVVGSPVFLDLTNHELTVRGRDVNVGSGIDTITLASSSTDPSVLVVTVNNDPFTLHWSDASTRINVSTLGGPDTVNVENVVGGPAVNIDMGDGTDAINLGQAAGNFATFVGWVTVGGGTGTKTLQIFDSANATSGRTYNLLSGGGLTIDGLPGARVLSSGFTNVALWTANGTSSTGNTVNLTAGGTSSTLAVHGGSMGDRLRIDFVAGSPIPAGGLTFDGGGGSNALELIGNSYLTETVARSGPTSDTVSLANLLSPTRTITLTSVQTINDPGIVPSLITPAKFLTVNASTAVDVISLSDGPVVNGIQTSQLTSNLYAVFNFANRTTTINCLDNNDSVTINSPNLAVGQLTINGGIGDDSFSLLAFGNRLVTINGQDGIDTITVNSPNPSTGRLTINGGNNDDSVRVTAATFQTTVNGDAGSNTLTGPNAVNTWTINGTNAGTLNSNITFTGMMNLTGNLSDDTFAFAPGGCVTGQLRGSGGYNLLDYSAYTADVIVNLILHTATATGGISSVENVTGGRGNNLLVGDSFANILRGGPGSGHNLLIGGGGADELTGGDSDSLLIGGTTDFDTNTAALNALFAEWSRTDRNFASRMFDLTHASVPGSLNGTYLLTPTTVHKDTSSDRLMPGMGTVWIFYDILDLIPLVPRPGDVYQRV